MKKLFINFVRFVLRLPLPQKIIDILTWPIATRILGKEFKTPVQLVEGFVMLGSMEDILARKVLFEGTWNKNLWEPLTTSKIEDIASKSKNILVAGSHIGYLVLKAAKHTNGMVYAFEPVPTLFEISKRNIALNPELSKKIVLTQAALGDKEGKVNFYVEDIRSSIIPYSGGHAKNNQITVDLTTIDKQTYEKGIVLDSILLDIEGYEWYALKGAEKTLSNRPDLILEISPKILSKTEITEEMIFKKLKDEGYSVEYLDRDKDYANIFAKVK